MRFIRDCADWFTATFQARSVELMTAAEAIDGVFAQAKAEDGTFGQSSDSESDS